MKRLLSSHRAKLAVSVVAIGVLSGCASVSLEQNVNRVNTETTGFTDGQLSLIAKHKAVFSKARTRHRSDQRCFELQVGP